MKNLTNNPLALSVAITAALVAPFATAAGHHAGISTASLAGPIAALLAPAGHVEPALPVPNALPAQTPVAKAAKPAIEAAPVVSVQLSNEEKALADRMALALAGHKVSKHRHSAQLSLQPGAASSSKPAQNAVWVCGESQELWQGRGAARTCEWR